MAMNLSVSKGRSIAFTPIDRSPNKPRKPPTTEIPPRTVPSSLILGSSFSVELIYEIMMLTKKAEIYFEQQMNAYFGQSKSRHVLQKYNSINTRTVNSRIPSIVLKMMYFSFNLLKIYLLSVMLISISADRMSICLEVTYLTKYVSGD